MFHLNFSIEINHKLGFNELFGKQTCLSYKGLVYYILKFYLAIL